MNRIALALLIAGCHSARPSRYVEGASVCSMVPVRKQCVCDGTERPATPEERLRVSPCDAIETMCEGKVHDCVDAPVGFPLR